jgi:hypothetical protein
MNFIYISGTLLVFSGSYISDEILVLIINLVFVAIFALLIRKKNAKAKLTDTPSVEENFDNNL